jgi:ribosomal protein L3 glutamine methyltransferase
MPEIKVADELLTVRDYWRHAISRFNAAKLSFGHGTTTATDDAAFLVLDSLDLPIDTLDPFLDARLTSAERKLLAERIEARVTTRKPSAYLTGRSYIQGIRFYVDERVIVPRSFIGEILFSEYDGEEDSLYLPDPNEASLTSAPARAASRSWPRASSLMPRSTRSISRPTRWRWPR